MLSIFILFYLKKFLGVSTSEFVLRRRKSCPFFEEFLGGSTSYIFVLKPNAVHFLKNLQIRLVDLCETYREKCCRNVARIFSSDSTCAIFSKTRGNAVHLSRKCFRVVRLLEFCETHGEIQSMFLGNFVRVIWLVRLCATNWSLWLTKIRATNRRTCCQFVSEKFLG